MVFSSLPFLFLFLPITLILYFIAPSIKWKNTVLTVMSLVFYAFGEPVYVFLLILCAYSGYRFGLIIEKNKERYPDKAKRALTATVLVALALLFVFKYLDFAISIINAIPFLNIPAPHLSLPIGISFFTFQTMSYDIDLYRGKAKVQNSFWTFLLYVSLFPQLIAGPILRYTDVQEQLDDRRTTPSMFVDGIVRFLEGCGKKVLLANTMGEFTNIVFGSDGIATGVPVFACWLGIFTYSLQLYFDFSGYSDMAIGLGKMFGFHYPENFDHPYISKSVAEYWRRWHISLGSFFRDYVYYPLTLGVGMKVRKFFSKKFNRKVGALIQNIFTMFVLWACTGLWHGASWNFVLWGLFYFVVLVLEEFVFKNKIENIPVFNHFITMFIVVVSRVLFYFEDISQGFTAMKNMFGFGGVPLWDSALTSRLVNYLIFIIIAVICCLPIGKPLKNYVRSYKRDVPAVYFTFTFLFCAVMLYLCVSSLVSSTYNPFLYFRF